MQSLRSALANINTFLIYAIALLIPISFIPLTTEYYSTGKLILLSAIVLVMVLVWGARILLENKLSLIKTPLDILLIIYLIIATFSTFFSTAPNLSLYGNLPRVEDSFIVIATLIILYFMVASNIKSVKQVQTTKDLLIIAGIILSLVSLLSYFQLFLPFAIAKTSAFSLGGNPASGAIFLSMLLPLTVSEFLRMRPLAKVTPIGVVGLVATVLFVITVILVGSLTAWIGAIIAIGIVIYQHRPQKEQVVAFFGLGIIALVLATLSYTPTLQNRTILGKLAGNFQREVQLPLGISWKISAGAFRDSPILGTGPATYLFNYTAYKPIETNQTNLWNIRLATAHDEFLKNLAELGGAGVLIMIMIALTFVIYAVKKPDNLGLGSAGIVFIIMMAFSPMSVLTLSMGFLIMALFMVSKSEGRLFQIELSSGQNTHILVPSLIFLPLLVLGVVGFLTIGKLALGQYYHRQALNALANNRAQDGYGALVAAERINPEVDLYRVDLAQTNFALANAIATNKGPSESSPGGSLTDQDKATIQQLLKQSIAEGQAATVLSPRSAANWEVVGVIYRQISGVAQNALQFSLDAYGRAIQRDPYNPLLRLAVGGVYYQAKNYDLAIRFFDDAVSLKPDYSNALYNLAIALRDKGSLKESIQVAESLVAKLQDNPKSNDYQTASSLLSDLKQRQATASANTIPQQTTEGSVPPAASTSAALQKEKLPKVLNLPKPENITTPSAVNK